MGINGDYRVLSLRPHILFFDQSAVALDDIARGAASVLVTSILEGF